MGRGVGVRKVAGRGDAGDRGDRGWREVASEGAGGRGGLEARELGGGSGWGERSSETRISNSCTVVSW